VRPSSDVAAADSPVSTGSSSFRSTSSKGNSPFPSVDGHRSPTTNALEVSWGAWGGAGRAGVDTAAACSFKRTSASSMPSPRTSASSMPNPLKRVPATPTTASVLERTAAAVDDAAAEEECWQQQEQAAHEKRLYSASLNASGAAAVKMMQEKSGLDGPNGRRIRRSSKDNVIIASEGAAPQAEAPSGAHDASTGVTVIAKMSTGGGALRSANPWECFVRSVHGVLGCDLGSVAA